MCTTRSTCNRHDKRCAWGACRYAQSHWWAGLDISKFANLQAWINRVGDKPAVKAGQSIPGISVLGSKGPTFAKLATDVELQVCLPSWACRRMKCLNIYATPAAPTPSRT